MLNIQKLYVTNPNLYQCVYTIAVHCINILKYISLELRKLTFGVFMVNLARDNRKFKFEIDIFELF